MIRDGHETKWDIADLPIAVYVDNSASEWLGIVYQAVKTLNAAVGRKVAMLPEAPFSAVRDAFENGNGIDGAAYLTTDRLVSSGSTDVRYHWHTGRIRNAFTRLSRYPGATGRLIVVLHELGHVMGLSHDNEPWQLMNAVISGREPPQYSRRTIALLRQLYGNS